MRKAKSPPRARLPHGTPPDVGFRVLTVENVVDPHNTEWQA